MSIANVNEVPEAQVAEELAAMPQDWQRALAVVAHPDDLEYGAAAAIAHWTAQGKEISYLLVTRGEAGIDSMEPAEAARVREREQRASAAAVGVPAVEFLDHRDGVIEYGVPLRRDLAAAIRRHRPELVLTISGDETWPGGYWNTPDHKAVARATVDAASDAGNRWIFPEQLADGGLERWDGVRWVAISVVAGATHAQQVTDEDVERAVASLTEHHAYLSALSDEPPEQYARTFLAATMDPLRQRLGHPAVAFRVHPR